MKYFVCEKIGEVIGLLCVWLEPYNCLRFLRVWGVFNFKKLFEVDEFGRTLNFLMRWKCFKTSQLLEKSFLDLLLSSSNNNKEVVMFWASSNLLLPLVVVPIDKAFQSIFSYVDSANIKTRIYGSHATSLFYNFNYKLSVNSLKNEANWRRLAIRWQHIGSNSQCFIIVQQQMLLTLIDWKWKVVCL